MKKKSILAVPLAAMMVLTLAGCSNQASSSTATQVAESSATPSQVAESSSADTASAESTAGNTLSDGEYSAEFNTDSSMFRVNEANGNKGVLTVKDGKMTIHVSLVSKNILNLYAGTAEEAQKAGAVLLEPTVDTVTYSDGTSEEVYGFNIPVAELDQPLDVAIVGTKGTWYDHKVTVSNPVAM